METKYRVTQIKGGVKGEWLQNIMDALDIKVSDLVREINAPNRRTIDNHLKKGNMGIDYLWSIKNRYPQINMNYLVFGERPILLGPNGVDADNLTAIQKANQILAARLSQSIQEKPEM